MEKLSVTYLILKGWKITQHEYKHPPYKVEWVVASQGDYQICINLALEVMLLTVYLNRRIIYQGRCRDSKDYETLQELIKLPNGIG